MTRKRFVKLAMSHGLPRNDAERTARMANGAMSYDEIFEIVARVKFIRLVVKAVSEWFFGRIRKC